MVSKMRHCVNFFRPPKCPSRQLSSWVASLIASHRRQSVQTQPVTSLSTKRSTGCQVINAGRGGLRGETAQPRSPKVVRLPDGAAGPIDKQRSPTPRRHRSSALVKNRRLSPEPAGDLGAPRLNQPSIRRCLSVERRVPSHRLVTDHHRRATTVKLPRLPAFVRGAFPHGGSAANAIDGADSKIHEIARHNTERTSC